MVTSKGVVIAYDAAGLRAVLLAHSRPVCQVAELHVLLLHIQDVAVCIHALQHHFGHLFIAASGLQNGFQTDVSNAMGPSIAQRVSRPAQAMPQPRRESRRLAETTQTADDFIAASSR